MHIVIFSSEQFKYPSLILDISNLNSILNLSCITLTELDIFNIISNLKLSSITGLAYLQFLTMTVDLS